MSMLLNYNYVIRELGNHSYSAPRVLSFRFYSNEFW